VEGRERRQDTLPDPPGGRRAVRHDRALRTLARPEGDTIESCTIVVTDANELVCEIHDRMPVILGREDYASWLDPGNKDADGLLAMLKPANAAPWTMHPVSRQVSSPRNDGPDLLEPVDAAG
jgi:putative SOS response-associated peptidase YedK